MKIKKISSILLGMMAVLAVSSCDLFKSNTNGDVTSSAVTGTNVPSNTTTGSIIPSTNTNTSPVTPTSQETTSETTSQETTTTTTTTTTTSTSGDDVVPDNPPVTFVVSFETNGGTSVNSQTIVAGNTISAVTTTKANYQFAGWFTDQDLTNSFNVNTPITNTLKLYAKWNPIVVDNILKEYNAYNEGAYVIFNVKNSTNAGNSSVSYSKDGKTFTAIDKELIRYDDNTKTARADILGLKAGSYVLKVNNGEGESITSTINVSADDRSGYAHFNRTTGVGAYNNDGTLKDNAVVVYVSDATKNTVTAKIGSSTYTGLVNIIKAANKDYPLDIRILDDIKTCQFNKITYNSSAKTVDLINEQAASLGGTYKGYSAADIISKGWNSYSEDIANGITELKNLSSSMSYSSGSSHNTSAYANAFDTAWNMCNVSSKENITIEGVGANAGIFQWGFSFSSCKSIEVKNLRFHNYTEDAVGIEGGNNFWLHNNTFDIGVNNWDLSDEKDKNDGDGASDFKKASNLTISYCRYNHTHKTNLIGGSNSNQQWNVTLHHNYYNQCSSRLPLGRQANMHFYNNYYYNCSTCQDIRANAFVLSEYNYFENCSNPQKVSVDSTYTGTVIKSYNDILNNCGSSAATVVTDRTAQLSGNCNGGTYTNFDTNTTYFYYDEKNKCSKVDILNSANDVKDIVPLYAGAGALPNFSIGTFNDIDTSGSGSEPGSGSTTTEQFTVTFITNGGSAITSQTVESGSTISSVSTTKDGFTFKGWFTDKGLTKSFDVNTPITSNLELYAKWEQNSSSQPQTGNTLTLSIPTTTGDKVENFTAGDFTITATSAKKVNINSDNIALNGGGSTEYRSIIANVGTTNEITITIKITGGNNDRYLVVADADGNSKSETLVTGDTLTIKVSGSTKYYLYSKSSGLNVYSLTITY